jgi:uncharacterized membrane protein YeaQ/YmgE (transglycosylase-associated protein family)
MIALILGLIITGLVIGALGRLAVPGPNPMGIGETILVGIAGSIISGLIVRAFTDTYGYSLLLAVIVTAGIVYLMQRRTAS